MTFAKSMQFRNSIYKTKGFVFDRRDKYARTVCNITRGIHEGRNIVRSVEVDTPNQNL